MIHYNGDAVRAGACTCSATGSRRARRPPRGSNPTPFEATDAYGALHRIQLADDTKRVGFIVHRRPPGDPNQKDTDPDRFFIPLATPEIWLRAGRRADLQLRGGRRDLRGAVERDPASRAAALV